MKITLNDIQSAADIVYKSMSPTPQYCWPLLCEHLGTEVWVKHENHTPVGAFKIRGGLVYFATHMDSGVLDRGVISATRGNHGQSLGFAARHHGVPATVVVPEGSSTEKNAAMRALGVELIEYGSDFQEAREEAIRLAQTKGLHMMPSFHPSLVTGVATYSLELLQAVSDLDVIYVPIGLGSGICGMIAARDALGLKTQIVGVVSTHAKAYYESFVSRQPTESAASTKLADGMACRVPEPEALEMIWHGVDRVVTVTDQEVAAAMRILFESTHNVCEGAGAAATAAALQERHRNTGRNIAVSASGGNVDSSVFASILSNNY